MQIVSYLAGLVAFVVGIIVLIKLFQKEGVLKGILGLICMLYTYIWGWQHSKEQNITNIMWVWTAVIVVSIIINIIFPPVATPVVSPDASSMILFPVL